MYKNVSFKEITDQRGSLVALEQGIEIPFDMKRVYFIYGVGGDDRRGLHAHRNLKQLMVCVSGNCKVLLDDGGEKVVVSLNSPSKGITVNSMVWREMYDFSEGCVLMVVADDIYRECDYIRDYELFQEELKK